MGNSKNTEEKIIKELDEQIKTKKTPNKVQEDINNNVFRNIMLAIVIMLYFYFINLGCINIKPESYLIDLKVFTFSLMITTIVLFEKAYKKDSGKLTIHGIEILILSIASLFAIHLYVAIPNKYIYIYTLLSYIYAIYYIMKSIIIYKKKKKEYKLSKAKEITNKENKQNETETKQQNIPNNNKTAEKETKKKSTNKKEGLKKEKVKNQKKEKEVKKEKTKKHTKTPEAKHKKSEKGKRFKKEGK